MRRFAEMNPQSRSTFWILWLLLLSVLLAGTGYSSDRSPSLELKVSVLKDSNLFPGAKGYSATLTNTTSKAIPLELVQYTPGYLGGAIFYPCAMQLWNSKVKQWQTVPPGNRRSEHSIGHIIHSEMKANETIEVCRKQLEKEWIRGGRCARFAFTFHWDHKPDILSEPFVIPDPDNAGKTIRCPVKAGEEEQGKREGGSQGRGLWDVPRHDYAAGRSLALPPG